MIKICNNYVSMWEARCYKGGIPDEVPQEIFHRAPSYKLIAHAILKNNPEMLGEVRRPCASYIMLKRKELSQRGAKIRGSQQLKLEI